MISEMGDIILSSDEYFKEFTDSFKVACENNIFESNSVARVYFNLFKDCFKLNLKISYKQELIKMASQSDDYDIVNSLFGFDPYDAKNFHRMLVVFLKLVSKSYKAKEESIKEETEDENQEENKEDY